MPDVVTFCMYVRDGRIMMVRRGLTDRNGSPLEGDGRFTVNGGLMLEGEDARAGLGRLLAKEYGLGGDVIPDFCKFVGDLWDREEERTNHVFRVEIPLEDWMDDFRACSGVFEKTLINPKGFGMVPLGLKDIGDIRAAGMLRPVAAEAFGTYPDLLPRI